MAKKWHKETIPLHKHHGWRGTPGYKIFVADRGAVRFHYPQAWVVVPADDCIKFHDVAPPQDNCTLAFSYLRLPPIDWSGLPLETLLRDLAQKDRRGVVSVRPVVTVAREDMELAWLELCFVDPVEKRRAYSRMGLGRGSNLQALLTLDFWPEDAERLAPMWEELLRSLLLGWYIPDPSRGYATT